MADYIGREDFIADAKKRYCEPCKGHGEDYNGVRCRACWVDDMISDIDDASAADVEPVRHGRWIPCSERLPESGTECNVVWVNHNPQPYYAEIKDVPGVAAAIYYKGKWYWWSSTCEDILGEYGKNDFDKIDDCIQITHWMPLPEPLEEGGDEDAAD